MRQPPFATLITQLINIVTMLLLWSRFATVSDAAQCTEALTTKDTDTIDKHWQACTAAFTPHWNAIPRAQRTPTSKNKFPILIGEYHGATNNGLEAQNAQAIASCLNAFHRKGDHMLLEHPSSQPIPCDHLGATYKPFATTLQCSGWDVMTDQRYLSLKYMLLSRELIGIERQMIPISSSTKALRTHMRSKADFLSANAQSSESFLLAKDVLDKTTRQRIGNLATTYLRTWQKQIKVMSLQQAQQFFIAQNQIYNQKVAAAFDQGMTTRNQRMLERIENMLSDSHSSKQRLFVVAGDDHVNPKRNNDLKEFIESKNPVLILRPKDDSTYYHHEKPKM